MLTSAYPNASFTAIRRRSQNSTTQMAHAVISEDNAANDAIINKIIEVWIRSALNEFEQNEYWIFSGEKSIYG